jgi:hypothetical protein
MSTDYKDLIERLRSYARDYTSTTFHEDLVLDAADAIAALVAERDAAVADADRYSVLRDGDNWPAVFANAHAPEPLRGDYLDDAVDAARQHTAKEPKP